MKRILKRIGYSGLILTSIVFLIIFSRSIYNQLKEHQIEILSSKAEAQIYRLKEHIVERLMRAQQDTVFISSYLEDHLPENTGSNELDPIGDELDKVAPSLMNVNQLFSGIYYFDAGNSDSVYINAEGNVELKQPESFIRDRCYLHASGLSEGMIDTDFDSDSIYISTPVYTEGNSFLGVIISVVDENVLLNELLGFISKGDILLMDDTGKYILASDSHNGITNYLAEYSKEQFNTILQAQSGESICDSSDIVSYVPVEIGDRMWYIILNTNINSATAELSKLNSQFILVMLIAFLAIIAAVAFWVSSNKKDVLAKKERALNSRLEEVNSQLKSKQYSLEEQNTLIEELNAQLADENERYLRQRDQLEVLNIELLDNKYTLERQNIVIGELNTSLTKENERYLQQKNILQAIIDSLGAGIIMVNSSGEIVFINKAWRELFHYLDTNVNQELFKHFYLDEQTIGDPVKFVNDAMAGMVDSENIISKLFSLVQDNISRYQVDIEQTEPVKRFLHLYSNPCNSNNGANYGRVFVIRDISNEKEVERLKMELISTVSHELRTPMSSILGFSELLLTRKLSEERSREYIGIINSEAMRLTELINDFLDIQRMESGKQIYNKQYDSIDQIIEESIRIFSASPKHNICYDKYIDGNIKLYCDRNKILQVLSNLLSNAIKYSPNGGDIKISLAAENGRIKVSVADNGLGIPEEVKNKLFSKFFRVDNDDRREIGGTGLGLAICKEIVHAHGGEIGVQSVFGQGSTFYFYLPFTISSDMNANAAVRASVTGEDRKLLLVEDDASTVKLIKEILKDEDLEIVDVSSGEEALCMIKEKSYKLILLDITLSGNLNGWDVIREMRSIPEAAEIPIIISSVSENKMAGSQDELIGYLGKPFEAEQLITMVHNAVKGMLKSKMIIRSVDVLTEDMIQMLGKRNISVKNIERNGNILYITLDGDEGLTNE